MAVLPQVLSGFTFPVTLSDSVDLGTPNISAAFLMDIPLLTSFNADAMEVSSQFVMFSNCKTIKLNIYHS